MIKKVTEKIIVSGSKVLRDQLYFIKVNNMHRDNILFTEKLLLPEIIKSLRKKNEVLVTKVT